MKNSCLNNNNIFVNNYENWRKELTQNLGYSRFPITLSAATKYVEKWLKAPKPWKEEYLTSSFNEESFRAAISKLFEDWHEEPKKAIEAILARFAWLDACYDGDDAVVLNYKGMTFVIRATKVAVTVHFENGLKNDKISSYLKNGVVGIPSALVIEALAEYVSATGGAQ